MQGQNKTETINKCTEQIYDLFVSSGLKRLENDAQKSVAPRDNVCHWNIQLCKISINEILCAIITTVPPRAFKGLTVSLIHVDNDYLLNSIYQ